MQARDSTYEKWVNEKGKGSPQYKDVINILKGKSEDTIMVTYEWKGLYRSDAPKEAAEIVPWYVFAFQDYDPETCFLSHLPSFTLREREKIREIMRKRSEEQKILYHKYFYIESIIKNLKLNKLINEDENEHILVHYNFFSTFLHPNKRIVRTKPTDFSFSFSNRDSKPHSELVYLYLCKFQFLFLSKILAYFEKHYPKGIYVEYKKHVLELDGASKDLWFLDNSPTDYDIFTSKTTNWWREKSGAEVKNDRVLYYQDPLERLGYLINWRSKLTKS